MARRFYGKRRYTKKKAVPWYAKKYSVGDMAMQALKGVNYVKGLVNSERMYFDFQTQITPDYAGSIQLVTGIAVGDDDGQRTGNSILARSLYFNASLAINTGGTTNIARIMIIMDTMNTGTTPTVTDILQSISSAYAPLSPINVDHTSRYKILFDRKYTLSINGTRMIRVSKYLKLFKHIKYTGTASTDVYKNNIYVLSISDVAATLPTLTYTSRLGYHDN